MGGGDSTASAPKGSDDSIEFVVCYREEPEVQQITYELNIDKDESGRPYVSYEILHQQRIGQSNGLPLAFLILANGRGIAWKGEAQGQQIDESADVGFDLRRMISRLTEGGLAAAESDETEFVELQDKRRLGIANPRCLEAASPNIGIPGVCRGLVLELLYPGTPPVACRWPARKGA